MSELDMEGFQRRIREARKARRMSLDDVALAAGFTKSHIWELEKGTARKGGQQWLNRPATCG